ncbi:hypothetical protein DSECCO2_468260 [anaerobic digester metagenome]
MKCNICGCSEFEDVRSRKSVKCKTCGSLERTRLIWFYLKKLKIDHNTRILHLAPEKGLCDKLFELAGDNYVPADYNPSRYSFAKNCRKIDLCAMESWSSNEFDLVLHVHVLEHTPCSIAYSLFHLHRILKVSGVHICIIPFMPGKYDESFEDIGDEERMKRFGQFDHVRKFGQDDVQMHLGKIIDVNPFYDARDVVSEDELVEANVPTYHWRGFHAGTVLMLNKFDYKIGNM